MTLIDKKAPRMALSALPLNLIVHHEIEGFQGCYVAVYLS
jgi:hypothetical protein